MEGFPISVPLDWNHPLLLPFIKAVHQLLKAEPLGPSDPRELKRKPKSCWNCNSLGGFKRDMEIKLPYREKQPVTEGNESLQQGEE